MSQNQLRGDKKDLQYRKTGVVGGVRQNNSSDYQQRPLSGGSGTAPALSSNVPASRSCKKPNNAQGGQSRGHAVPVNSSSDPNPSAGVRPVEHSSHVQSTVSGVSHKPAPAVIPTSVDASSQKSNQPIPKSPLSQTSSMTSDPTFLVTPSKGDAGKGFSLQFGSITPGFVRVMQVPARTSSAPPNVAEQQRNQSLGTTSRASPANPVPSAPKQLMTKLDGSAEKPTPQEPPSSAKVTRDVPVTSTPHPSIQTQTPTGPPVPPISIPMPYTQPTGPMQFGGPNPPILPQGMRPNSHQMPMQMAFGGPNSQIPTQVQQPVFMTGLQHHLMPNQGIIHQGPSFGFNPQMVHQLPHQPGNLVMNIPPQLNQQGVKIDSDRKTIKITHPDTHEELKLDDKKDGSPSSRVTRITHPQSQPIPPYAGARSGGLYPSSYSSSSSFTPQPNSLPMTSNSLAPRFNYLMPRRPEPSNLESVWSTPQVRSLAPSPLVSTLLTAKPAGNAIENASSTSVNLKVNPDSSSPQLKSMFESSKQTGVFVPPSPNTDVDNETVTESREQSGQKGHLQRTSQGHGGLLKVTTSQSTAKCTPSAPGSKEDVLDAVHNSSARVDAALSAMCASGNGIEDKFINNKPVIKKDSHLQSLTKPESETDPSLGLQLDNSSKPTDVKKPYHEAGLLAASQAEKITTNNYGTDEAHSANHSETNVDSEVEIFDDARPSSSSGIVSGSSKLSMEPNKTKNNKGKKKNKTLGANPDLNTAFKNPNEYKDTVVADESVLDHNTKDVPYSKLENGVVKKFGEQNKPYLENWEDVTDGSTPKLESSDNVKGRDFHHNDNVGTAKRYSRDFLLTFLDQCIDLPEGFQITPDIAEVLMRSNLNDSRDLSGVNDRTTGPARHDSRGNGSMDANRWSKPNRNHSNHDSGVDLSYANNMMGYRPGPVVRPRGQGPVQHGGGISPGIMHSMSFQGTYRNNHETDRWQRATSFNKSSTPSPQTPQQVMHKAEKKYEVGKVSDEEQAKQRRLKAILNKLTPQNFEKLFEQVKEVNIDNVVTLTGVISQIFDKALMEPTFCEMYANFCQRLASELPDLSVDNQKITFRRLLLNKCQEEFERGEREEEEVNKDEGETKQSDQEREEKRLKVRRRMLGNIRLIGELYKKRMLTERIMHECIKKLLGNYQDVDEENIEALCKLMSTIGEMIDHPKAKEHLDAYFDVMRQLSNDMKLSSRVRFMLKDTIDLRRNRWQQRRKVEGPKKIEEVHRAAAQERLGQTSRLTRGSSMNSSARRGMGPPLEYTQRGSVMSSPGVVGYRGVGQQSRGLLGQDPRIDDKNEFESRTLSVPLLQRPSGDGPIMLGPQGGLARGMSIKGQTSGPTADNSSSHGDSRRGWGGLNGFSNLSDHRGYNSQGDQFPKHEVPVGNDQPTSQEHNSNATLKLSVEKVYPEERLREMSMAAIKEYYSAKDDKEAELCVKELNAPSFYPTLVSMWVTDALERKDIDRTVLTKLLVSLSKPQDGIFSPNQLIQGFESLLTNFEDVVTDAPRAPEYLGRMFGTLVLENVLPLQDVCRLIHEGGEEPGRLLDIGLAGDVLGSILERIKSEKGDKTLNQIRTSCNIRLEDFLPPEPLKSRKLMMFL